MLSGTARPLRASATMASPELNGPGKAPNAPSAPTPSVTVASRSTPPKLVGSAFTAAATMASLAAPEAPALSGFT